MNKFFIFLLLAFASCNDSKTTGIEGNNNSGNVVVIGDNSKIEPYHLAHPDFLSINIGIDNQILNANFAFGKNGEKVVLDVDDVTYDSKLIGDTIVVTPTSKYLSLFNSNNSISNSTDFFYDFCNNFFIQYPNFDIKIVNNSDQTIFFNKAVLDVVESKIDTTPLIVVGDSYFQGMHIYKECWMNFTRCYIKYNLIPIDIKTFDFNYLPFQVNVPEINKDERVVVEVRNEMKSLGFNEELYERNCPFNFKRRYSIDNTIASMGRLTPMKILKEDDFPDIHQFVHYYTYAKIIGKIFIEYVDHSRTTKNRQVKFVTEFGLPVGGEGGPCETSSFQYETMLKTTGANYSIEKNISQYIKPKEIDRFTILVGAEMSSVHKFKLKLFYNNNQYLESPPINLYIFFPRSSKEQLDQLRMQNSNGILPSNKIKNVRVWVNDANLRESPNLQSKIKKTLPANSILYPMGEKSKNRYEVRLRGNKYVDYFYKVSTTSGEIGWIHGSVLK